jgi:serine/threonine-protein kinase RsbW
MTLKTCIHEKIVIKGLISELRDVGAKVLCLAQTLDYSDDDIFAVHLAIEEATVNAVKHGNKLNADKAITIEYEVTPEKIDIVVTDQGQGFDPETIEDPRCGKNIYKTGGRRVLLIKSYMNVVEYNKTGNSVHMIKLNSRHTR